MRYLVSRRFLSFVQTLSFTTFPRSFARMSSEPSAAPPAAAVEHKRPAKRPNHGEILKAKRTKTKREKGIKEGGSEEVLHYDVVALVEARRARDGREGSLEPEQETLPEEGTETEVEILELSSTGEGLGMKEGSEQVYVVPFTVPGDVARVKVFRHMRKQKQTVADFISIAKPSPIRDDSRIKCKYFGSCGGCQFQMLSYPEQMKLKRRIVEKAFKNFANLKPEAIPEIGETFESPLQYGYRTKLTPHFDGPPGYRPSKGGKNPRTPFQACPDIGFMQKGRRKVLDIEDCPIGTDAVRGGIVSERERMQTEYVNYKRGATILLRENTTRYPKDAAPEELPPHSVKVETDSHVDIKTCVTDSKTTTTEHFGEYTFTNPAGSFFQNNNSILGPFTDFVRSHILPPPNPSQIKYLIDAYSGSGLFTITLSSVFQHSTGIDISADSITSASKNAALNGLGPERAKFIAADAAELFKNVEYPADETVVVLDPPRKGCDESFLSQLRKLGPRRVLYVSCNVHTQARDVGYLVRGEGEGKRYEIESLRGFDFFPQTGHVEGVAILNRVDEVEQQNAAEAAPAETS